MECIAEFPNTLTDLVTEPAAQTRKLCKYYLFKKTGSCAHSIWAYPLNAIVTLGTALLMPLVALVNLVAAGVFKLIACCPGEDTIDWQQTSDKTLNLSWQCIAYMYILAGRIIYPPMKAD